MSYRLQWLDVAIADGSVAPIAGSNCAIARMCFVDILRDSRMCPFDILRDSRMCPFDILRDSRMCPFDILRDSRMCPFDILRFVGDVIDGGS